MSQADITRICNEKNPGLVERGFDKAIYEYAQKKGINPKVILATLAQEQNWCKNGKYDKAFGVGPGGNPSSFAENEKGGIAKTVSTYLRHFNNGLEQERNGGLKVMHVNQDYKVNGVWQETDAAARQEYGISGAEWMKKNPQYGEYLKKGIDITPVNAVMYAKLMYTPWVDFPVQKSHPLQEWHDLFRSF